MQFLYLVLACAGISFTVTVTSIFMPLREAVSKLHPKLEELIHCPWCLNHYVTFAVVAITQPEELERQGLWAYFLICFAVIAASGVIHFVLLRAYEPVSRAMLQRKLDKLQEEQEKHQQHE